MKKNKHRLSDAPGRERAVSRFIFMGDPQCDRTHCRTAADCRKRDETELPYTRWKTLLSAAEARIGQDAMLILAGDVVNRGHSDTEWKWFQQTCSERLAAGRVISVPGNCDRRYYGTLHFFSVEIGCMHLLMLDSNLMGSRNEEVVESIRGWIEEDLSRCTQPVKIAVMHHPMVTVGSSLDDSVRAATMRHAYWETLRRGGISFLLCGHQHLYCRRERDGITQVMGVSGTKYFDGPDLSGMEAVHLFVSNATLFESDGNAVKMTTIDPAGQVLDTVVRSVPGRPEARMETAGDDPARGHVSSSGDGVDAGLWRNARIDHPLPEHRCMPDLPERLFVCGVGMPAPTHLAPSELHRLPHRTAWFSVYRRGRICQQKKTGILLEELLRDAGWTGEGDGLIVSGQKGMVTAVRRQELMTARRFSVTGEDLGAALPMLCRQEDGRLQLVTGQRTCHSYNGKEWIDGVTALEVIDLAVYCQ